MKALQLAREGFQAEARVEGEAGHGVQQHEIMPSRRSSAQDHGVAGQAHSDPDLVVVVCGHAWDTQRRRLPAADLQPDRWGRSAVNRNEHGSCLWQPQAKKREALGSPVALARLQQRRPHAPQLIWERLENVVPITVETLARRHVEEQGWLRSGEEHFGAAASKLDTFNADFVCLHRAHAEEDHHELVSRSLLGRHLRWVGADSDLGASPDEAPVHKVLSPSRAVHALPRVPVAVEDHPARRPLALGVDTDVEIRVVGHRERENRPRQRVGRCTRTVVVVCQGGRHLQARNPLRTLRLQTGWKLHQTSPAVGVRGVTDARARQLSKRRGFGSLRAVLEPDVKMPLLVVISFRLLLRNRLPGNLAEISQGPRVGLEIYESRRPGKLPKGGRQRHDLELRISLRA
eukprot:scaffold8593_cov248-Pinguiococcus_pyrenoidosus.AAC.8